MSNLDKLLNFLTSQYYDSIIYFALDNEDKSDIIEVCFRQKRGPFWEVNLKSTPEEINRVTTERLVELLALKDANLVQFESQVEERALNIAAYASMRLDEVRDILGEQAIIDHIHDTTAWINQVAEAIESLLGVKRKPSLSIVKD